MVYSSIKGRGHKKTEYCWTLGGSLFSSYFLHRSDLARVSVVWLGAYWAFLWKYFPSNQGCLNIMFLLLSVHRVLSFELVAHLLSLIVQVSECRGRDPISTTIPPPSPTVGLESGFTGRQA